MNIKQDSRTDKDWGLGAVLDGVARGGFLQETGSKRDLNSGRCQGRV